ncbi:MAG: efflux RND transporter permease subunit [Patescibacteria group bacterium]|jgi:HAE1 family hydrophobic/amphiphilic exporter-1
MGDRSFGRKFINLIFNNGQIVALLFVFVVIAGSVSFYFFQPQGFPSMNLNMAVITATYPGASALQVEDKIVKPIERAIAEVKSVDEYTAAANDSFAVMTVTFDDKTEMTSAMQDLEGKLAGVELPEGVDKPKAKEIDVMGPTVMLAVTLDNSNSGADWELYEKAKIIVDELETVKGVKEVKISNPLTPEIEITFDSAKLSQMGIQRTQVEALLKAAQFEMPLGSFYDEQQDKYSLSVKRPLTEISELENMLIGPNVRLKDIATIKQTINNNDYYNRVGSRENDGDEAIEDAGGMRIDRAVVLWVMAETNEDVLALGERLDDKYAELEDDSRLSGNVRIIKVYDVAKYTGDQLSEIKKSIIGGNIEALGSLGVIGYLFGGITLVVLFLLIFVNWRVAVLAGLSIPLALGMTTAYLKLAGISINTIVLFSMILVVGLVVDPTIVFLEAMQRYREQGYSGKEAAIKTFNAVGLGVLLSAIANFVVFIPFGVVSGFFGQIIQYIPQTVIPAVVSSFIVPTLFFLPVGANWLKPSKKVQSQADGKSELVGVWAVSKWIGRLVTNLLGNGVGKQVARGLIILAAIIAPIAIGGAFIATEQVKVVQFASTGDADMVMITGTLSDRWAFDKAIKVIDPVQQYLSKQKEVSKFAVYEQTGNSFVMVAELFPMVERQDEDLRTAAKLVEDANDYFGGLQGAEVVATMDESAPPQEAYPVSIRLFDQDLDKLQKAANDVEEFLKTQDGVTKTENSLKVDDKSSGTALVLDTNNLMNLNPLALANVVKNQLDETEVINLKLDDEVYKVITKMDKTIDSLDEIKQLPVSTAVGSTMTGVISVPTVDNLITGTEAQAAQSIERLDGKRYVTIRAKVDSETDPLKVQSELTKYLDDDKLDALGLDAESATETEGVAGAITESFGQLFIALIIALFLIYIILVGFFRSILSPIIILFAVPLGFIGVFPAVAIATGQLGFLELLGVVAMAGIVVNVTILIIDFANQMRAKGMSAQEAIATSITVRFKPILLTKMTIFAGLMPLALFSPFWRGLATVIVFGIIVSGFLSFVTTPILYVWFDAMGKWFGSRRRRDNIQYPMTNNQSGQAVWPVNPMQAIPMTSENRPLVEPGVGLWGELPDNLTNLHQSNQSRQSDQWGGGSNQPQQSDQSGLDN